jgi:nucleotide-binding universal stress UspA family protein
MSSRKLTEAARWLHPLAQRWEAVMAYKDLLVHLDDSKGCARRVDAAVRLAQQHGAYLTGIYPIVEIPLLNYIREQIPQDIQARMEAEAQQQADTALKSFRQAAEGGGVSYGTRTDRALDTTLAGVLSMHARYADLVVLGQVDPDGPPYVGSDLPEQVVLACGRPVLVVPHDWAPGPLGERVLIAWDASRAAARAVSDALPILERAESVLVVSVNPKQTPLGHGELPGADIALHLARHNLEVEVQSVETDRMDIGEALLSFAADRGCDLLVMGAYAHSRVRELVLGGATRTMLKSMTLPVLMAH